MSNKPTAHTSNSAPEWLIFALVSTAFANIYITQPILPVLQADFGSDTVSVARTVSAVLLGFAVANLPFGFLSDRVSIRPLVLIGGVAIAAAGWVCAVSEQLNTLIAARFVQGLFMPAVTTCLAAWLAKTLTRERLNVAMGSYVAATILGGMFGRLLGGYIHDPDAWRGAFVSAAVLVLITSLVAAMRLPQHAATVSQQHRDVRYRDLLKRRDLLPIYLCAAAGQAIFSPVFNTVPYRLAEAPMLLGSEQSSLVYLVYLLGVIMGPAAGRLSNRLGNGTTLMLGAAVLAGSLAVLLIGSVGAVVLALAGICAGFFGVHAAAVGALNRKLHYGQGRANALYVMAYYLGAWLGVVWSAWVYQHFGWPFMVGIAMALTLIPFAVGYLEQQRVPSVT